MEVDYYSKYLKYKSKYLTLKTQLGSSNRCPAKQKEKTCTDNGCIWYLDENNNKYKCRETMICESYKPDSDLKCPYKDEEGSVCVNKDGNCVDECKYIKDQCYKTCNNEKCNNECYKQFTICHKKNGKDFY